MEPTITGVHLVGYLYASIVGHLCVNLLVDELWRPDALRREYSHHPRMIGVLERTMYAVAWQLNQQGFIAIWLSLKVAGQWKRWTEDGHGPGEEAGAARVPGRAVFNIFLIGSGFSIVFGVVGGVFPKLVESSRLMSVPTSQWFRVDEWFELSERFSLLFWMLSPIIAAIMFWMWALVENFRKTKRAP